MSDWIETVEAIRPEPGKPPLTTTQVQALVDILCLIVFAGNRCSALEAEEFNGALLNVDSLRDHEQVIKAQLNVAAGPARHADDSGRAKLARRAAQTLNGSGLRSSVYQVAASLMCSPLNADRQEPAVLETIKEAFEI